MIQTPTGIYIICSAERGMLLPVDMFVWIMRLWIEKDFFIIWKQAAADAAVLMLFFVRVLFEWLVMIWNVFFSLFWISSITDNVRKHIISHGRDKFLVNATVVDVDPKTPEHYVKYIKQTNASHRAYRGTLNNELESTDGKLNFVWKFAFDYTLPNNVRLFVRLFAIESLEFKWMNQFFVQKLIRLFGLM